ncbi:MAG: response regulator transcription factor [Bacteroidetes bacterium]|nr:response regulator transcription factor [Bacteroidota bacterium]
MAIRIGLVDDHQLFSKSLSLLLKSIDGYVIEVEACNGKDLQQKLSARPAPDIMLIDVNMPLMDGRETARWLRASYPFMKMVALSMDDKESTIISMLKAGCCSYLYKDIHPEELESALHHVYQYGYYNLDALHNKNRKAMNDNEAQASVHLSDKESEFVLLACSDLTYKEIAHRMNHSERTIDGYRESVFKKYQVQSRVGMALEAIRRGLVIL